MLTIIAFGLLSVLYFRELATGDGLARSVCAFIAIFWGMRLVVALFVFDANEFLTTWYFKVGYHLLTVTFIYQTVAYGYCAIF